jgi:hypothetical protein
LNRSIAAAAVTAFAFGSLAFAPAPSAQQPTTSEAISRHDATVTSGSGLPGVAEGEPATSVEALDVTEPLIAGGTPEATGYGWSFAYNGDEYELARKFTNYSRGACAPTAGSCPPARGPGVGYLSLRGNCTTSTHGANLTLCEELGGVNDIFDPEDGTISILLGAEMVSVDGVAACDTISSSPSFIGQSVWAASSVFVTSSAFPYDHAVRHLHLSCRSRTPSPAAATASAAAHDLTTPIATGWALVCRPGHDLRHALTVMMSGSLKMCASV